MIRLVIWDANEDKWWVEVAGIYKKYRVTNPVTSSGIPFAAIWRQDGREHYI